MPPRAVNYETVARALVPAPFPITFKQARLAQPILLKQMLGKLSLTHAVELCHDQRDPEQVAEELQLI